MDHDMPWPRFLLANAAGAAVWVGLVVTMGMLIRDNLHRAHTLLTGAGLAMLAVTIVAVSAGLLLARRRRARSQDARPETRAEADQPP